MPVHISIMLAVDDARKAAAWYKHALGAIELWSVGTVVGLAIDGAPFFLHEPTHGFVSPSDVTTARVEVFVDDPDAFVRRAIDAGADGSSDPVRDHETPWGRHRQGGFRDPFRHVWLVGDGRRLSGASGRPDRPAGPARSTLREREGRAE